MTRESFLIGPSRGALARIATGALLGVSLTALAAALGVAAAASPVLRVENRSATPIRDLYVKKAGEPEWGKNLIEGDSIAAGGARRLDVAEDGGCRYDVLVVFQDGRSEGSDDVDLCQREAFVIEGAAEPESAQKR